MGRIKEETLSGVKWQMIQRLTMKPLNFVYATVLARLVSPDEMGVLGLTGVFFSLAGHLTYCGLGTALIRKQNRTEEDCSTVFWYNVIMSGLLMVAFWVAAPLFARHFDIPDLCPLTIVSSVMMFFGAAGGVHYTLYQARRDFKTPAVIALATSLITMPLTILLAYMGYSYWSITISGFVGSLISLVAVWIVSPWRPRFIFSKASFHEFFFFGLRLTLTGVITNIFDGTRNFIVGTIYKPAQLALYNRAFEFCTLPLGQLDGIWKGVALPILATIQDDEQRLINVYTKYIRFASMVIQGGMMTLAANAYSLVYCLYGSEWIPCVVYVQVLCFAVMFNPITYINENIFIVRNRTDALLRREVIMRSVGIVIILIGVYHSMMALCFAAILSDMFCCFFSIYMTRRIINIPFISQVRAFAPYIFLAILANIPSYFINQADYSPYLLAPVGCVVSAGIYYCILRAMGDPCLDIFMNMLRERVLSKLPFIKRFTA